ncbi:hypothetical protein GW932_05310 [archaeon]|nr:hypothetical protein [archaeon]
MKSKKGLSGIVTTLIIILLVLVAVGVIWGVVNNLLTKSTGTIATSSKCLDLDIRATKVIQGTTATQYNVTLARKATGDDTEVGAMLVFYSDTTNSPPVEFTDTLSPLETSTQPVEGVIANATYIEVTPFFVDDSGKNNLCPSSSKFEFDL